MPKKILAVKNLSSNKEIKNILIFSGSIAHEFKNYLSAINICANVSENNIISIKKKIKTANYLINNLLLQIKGVTGGLPRPKDFTLYSITKNITEVLDQYFFEDDARNLITIEKSKDFAYKGNPVLTNAIFYNLIKNSLRAIADSGKGKIIITLDTTTNKKFNILLFKDTACGIPKSLLPKIFKLFTTKSQTINGAGFGLAFCKIIMQSYGGNIICNSIERQYTKFILKFPRIT